MREQYGTIATSNSPKSVMLMTFPGIFRLRAEIAFPILDELTLGYRSNVRICRFVCLARDSLVFSQADQNAYHYYTAGITANLGYPMMTE